MGIFKQKDDPTSKILKEIIDDNPMTLSGESIKKLQEEYKILRDTYITAAQLESEKFDKGILTLSSIFLGFTLTFVDKIIPLHTAWYRWLLYISWVSFFVSIISILFGLLVNQKSIKQMLRGAGKYFLERNLNYSNFPNNKLNKLAGVLNYVSLILFVMGAGLFILFVIVNVTRL